MNTDIRISVGFWQHPKTKKTIKRLGLEGIMSLQMLWIWAAQNRPDGNLRGMDGEDIELAASWEGEEGLFFSTCCGLWIDDNQDGLRLHDWEEHNPWVSGSEARKVAASAAGRASAEARKQRKANEQQTQNNGEATRCSTNFNDALPSVGDSFNGLLTTVDSSCNGFSTPLPSPKNLRSKNTITPSTTVNEGRARADVVPGVFVSSSDELLGEEGQEVAGGELLQAAGTLDMGIEFQELRAHYDQHGRAEAVAAGFAEYKQLRASRQWPGFARIMQAIDDYSTTQKWRAGFAPGLARFLRERWWLKAPMQEAESPAAGALDGGDTYTRLLEEVRKEANV